MSSFYISRENLVRLLRLIRRNLEIEDANNEVEENRLLDAMPASVIRLSVIGMMAQLKIPLDRIDDLPAALDEWEVKHAKEKSQAAKLATQVIQQAKNGESK